MDNEDGAESIRGIGVDIVEISRIETALKRRRRFAERLFSAEEIAYCSSRNDPAVHYAVRFAAKEAVAKALGTGFRRGVSWREIKISRSADGRPSISFCGKTASIVHDLGIAKVLVSVSFDHQRAVASAISIGKDR